MFSAWPIILVHMILSIDTIGPKAQRTKQKSPPNPVHCCLSHSRFGDYGLVKHPNGVSDLHTDKPPSSHETAAGVNDEPPYTLGTSHRFADLRSPTVNCHSHENIQYRKPTVGLGERPAKERSATDHSTVDQTTGDLQLVASSLALRGDAI